MRLQQRLLAEIFGTFWLVIGGCGSAVLAAKFPGTGIGFVGVALAFGLTVLTMAYAIGHISGCHLNPAVSVGLAVAGRFPGKELVPYIVAQVVGATLGAFVLYLIASGVPGFDAAASGFATNGYGARSPGGYSMRAALVCEIVMTFFFLMVILGTTDGRAIYRFRAACHRTLPDADSPDIHSGDQYLGQSRTLDRTCAVCRRCGAGTALAFLGRADYRGRHCGGVISAALPREGHGRGARHQWLSTRLECGPRAWPRSMRTLTASTAPREVCSRKKQMARRGGPFEFMQSSRAVTNYSGWMFDACRPFGPCFAS